MAYLGSQTNDEFSAGVSHLINPGRANAGSITLGGALQADSARWDSMIPHGVLHTALNAGSPADTDAGIEFGQESVGNTDDTQQAGESMARMMMQRAAGIGSDDNTA